jgi:hypothetical protein
MNCTQMFCDVRAWRMDAIKVLLHFNVQERSVPYSPILSTFRLLCTLY